MYAHHSVTQMTSERQPKLIYVCKIMIHPVFTPSFGKPKRSATRTIGNWVYWRAKRLFQGLFRNAVVFPLILSDSYAPDMLIWYNRGVRQSASRAFSSRWLGHLCCPSPILFASWWTHLRVCLHVPLLQPWRSRYWKNVPSFGSAKLLRLLQ